MSEYIVEMHHIVKNFGDVKAVIDGKFTLKKGEIHSLIGENGAGKSTMMKMLYGLYPPSSGTIKIKGSCVDDTYSPSDAIERGIGMVHQEFMLVNEMTVLDNIILGAEPRRKFVIDFEKARSEINYFIDTYGLKIQLNKRINQISVGEAQRVEIIKTLYRGAEIILLDEPTAVLTPQETKGLFNILFELKKDGKSIVFISHKLDEVIEISERITVMRRGKFIGEVKKEDTNNAELTQMMVGRSVLLNVKKTETQFTEVVLDVENLWTSGEKELSKIRELSLRIRSGEIVGIAGVDGNGQSELIEAITGLRKVEKGKITLCNHDITNLSVKKIRASGLTHIPEDRNLRGLNREMSIEDNLIAVKIDSSKYSKGIILDNQEALKSSEVLVEQFDVRPSNPEALVSSLSGGNAQKVVFAREIDADGKLLIASQPTRGVDIGAIESIREILMKQKEKGTAILLVSADLEEILSLSDTIVVMYEGKINGILSANKANEDNVSMLMMGRSEITKREVANG